jgi:hypothetical protein
MISAINSYFISRFVGFFKRSSCEPLNESVSNDSISDKEEEEKEKEDDKKEKEEKKEDEEDKDEKKEDMKKVSSWEDFFLSFF